MDSREYWLDMNLYVDSDISDEEFERVVNVDKFDIHKINSSGHYMLHYYMCPHKLMLLINHGADVNAISKTGDTPLLNAVNRSPDDRNHEMCLILLEHGADITLRNNNNQDVFDILKRIIEFQSNCIAVYDKELDGMKLFNKDSRYEYHVESIRNANKCHEILLNHVNKTKSFFDRMLYLLKNDEIEEENTNKRRKK